MSEKARLNLLKNIDRLEKTIEVIAKVRCALACVEHHKSISARFDKKFRELYPAYTFSFVGSGSGIFSTSEIRVWGNGIDYNDCHLISGKFHEYADIKTALDEREKGLRDQIDKYRLEIEILPELDRISDQIEGLQAQAKKLTYAVDPKYGESGALSENYRVIFPR